MPVVFKAPPLPVLFTVAEAPPMKRMKRVNSKYSSVRAIYSQVASGVNAQ